MQVGMRRRRLCAPQSVCCRCRQLFGVVTVVLTGFLAAGCSTISQPTAGFGIPRGVTVAFESIDGAPPAVFRKLVQNLSEAAAARAVSVVSRQETAEYRVRGYLAARATGGRATYSWVWDVYDRDQNRALRIAGAQSADAAGNDALGENPWAAADESLLRDIARASIDRVATFLGAAGPAPAATPVPSEQQTYAVAGASPGDDFSPQAWGIFRIFRVSNASAPAAGTRDAATPSAPTDVPLPRRRPRAADVRPDRVLAYANAQR
jgi:hypothetical protein